MSAEPAAAAIPGVLEREAVTRPRAIRAGIAAVILTVITIAIAALAQGARPTVTLLDALNVAAGVPLDRPGLTSELLRYYDDTFLPFLAIAIAQGLSFIAYGAVLLVLVDAVTARGVKVPRVARPAAATGAVLSGITTIALQIAVQANVSSALDAKDWLALPTGSDAVRFGQFVLFFSTLSLAVATVLIALAAMRAGLLTKFLGWVGVGVGAVGGFTLLTAGGADFMSYTFQMMWLLLVVVALAGRGPAGRPPAWDAGVAVPWPTQQELRESRGTGPAPLVPRRAPDTPDPSPATSKKKRKKRR